MVGASTRVKSWLTATPAVGTDTLARPMRSPNTPNVTPSVDAGEVHSATLLATTALGAVETLQGTEYGLEIRTLCADALKRAGSPQAATTRQRTVDYATALMETIRDARLRRCFSERPMVAALFDATPSPLAETGTTVKRPSAPSMP